MCQKTFNELCVWVLWTEASAESQADQGEARELTMDIFNQKPFPSQEKRSKKNINNDIVPMEKASRCLMDEGSMNDQTNHDYNSGSSSNLSDIIKKFSRVERGSIQSALSPRTLGFHLTLSYLMDMYPLEALQIS